MTASPSVPCAVDGSRNQLPSTAAMPSPSINSSGVATPRDLRAGEVAEAEAALYKERYARIRNKCQRLQQLLDTLENDRNAKEKLADSRKARMVQEKVMRQLNEGLLRELQEKNRELQKQLKHAKEHSLTGQKVDFEDINASPSASIIDSNRQLPSSRHDGASSPEHSAAASQRSTPSHQGPQSSNFANT